MATDSYKFEMTGLSACSMGAVGVDGAMGAVLVPYLVRDGKATLNIAPPSQTDIDIYQTDTAYAILNGKQPKDFTVDLLDLKLSQLPTFMGGTYTASVLTVPDRWDAPTIIPTIILSVKLSSKDGAGNAVSLVFPRCQIVASTNGSLSKTDLIGLTVKVNILAPVQSDGTILSSWGIDGEANPA